MTSHDVTVAVDDENPGAFAKIGEGIETQVLRPRERAGGHDVLSPRRG